MTWLKHSAENSQRPVGGELLIGVIDYHGKLKSKNMRVLTIQLLFLPLYYRTAKEFKMTGMANSTIAKK
jgi:hypothetical protein